MQILGQDAPLVLLHREQVRGVCLLLARTVRLLGQVDKHDLDKAFTGADIKGASLRHEHAVPHRQAGDHPIQDRRHRGAN